MPSRTHICRAIVLLVVLAVMVGIGPPAFASLPAISDIVTAVTDEGPPSIPPILFTGIGFVLALTATFLFRRTRQKHQQKNASKRRTPK